MGKFEREYHNLNAAQRKAVDNIDGPVLVIAGPGTGKTQLISVRVANILNLTGIEPSSILCLTYTDNAARNMRERLESIIGQPAYHVTIHTFHSFGAEIINHYPDYFTHRQMLQQVGELGSYEILREIFEQLPHSNPFSSKLSDDEYVLLKDALNVISWLKQSAISPEELHKIVLSNNEFIKTIANELAKVFAVSPSPKQLKSYQRLQKLAEKQSQIPRLFGFPPLAGEFAYELSEAIADTPATGPYAPAITSWRNKWCIKDSAGQHVIKERGRNARKLQALANIYRKLLDEMSRRGVYDFDDMIVETVKALERHDELRLTLQERYQYILVDEFQDTNKAQLRILTSLGNNPVNEERPNIMAVGDDDQAIYAFQGAEVSNIVAFTKLYRDPIIIQLTKNYRSTRQILEASFTVANQISDRLETKLLGTRSSLTPVVKYQKQQMQHNVFLSELAQYDWIAEQIQKLIKNGAQPQEIAVIAPRHRYLERLMPYLGNRHIPVAYERRENILDTPLINQLISMSELVVALSNNNQAQADQLFSEVLGYDFWGISTKILIDLSLQVYHRHLHWLEVLIKHENQNLKKITAWFVGLARHSRTEPLEYLLDELLGVLPDGVDSEFDDIDVAKKKAGFVSPMRAFYFNTKRYNQATDVYLALLGQLSTMRQKLRLWKPDTPLYIRDIVEFVALHRQAKLKIVDENPHTQTTNAVQVMTSFKAKGLEFDVVFIINAQDEIWGPTARRAVKRITLPKNLPIAPTSDGNNDKLRVLFVSLTRARHSVYITSYSNDLNNKLSPGLSFIGGNQPDSQPIHTAFTPHFVDKPDNVQALEILSTDWAYRFRQILADKPNLFKPILEKYRLSVTHLSNFIDVSGAGPQYFLVHNLLRFPEAITPAAAYGDSIHKTLQWIYISMRNTGKLPKQSAIQRFFDDTLSRKHLRKTNFIRLQKRGHDSLRLYLKKRAKNITPKDLIERGFNNDGVVIAGARLSGKIDKIHFEDSGVSVIDFKTGKPSNNWLGKEEYEKLKLHKYRQQLLFYKLLVENSASYKGKLMVNHGELEFIEPADNGELVNNLRLDFDSKELLRFRSLIAAVWQHITALNFPVTSSYSPNLKGVISFEDDLLSGKV